MGFRFGCKLLLPLWLVSLLTGCAWAVPALSPPVSNHQYPVIANVSYGDTATPDMYITRDNASYETTYIYMRSRLVAGVSEIPLRLRVTHGIATARNDKTSTGVTTVAHCEIFSPRLEEL